MGKKHWQEEVGCGAASSIVARFVIAPLDVVKIRLQVQTSPSATRIQYRSMWDCLATMTRVEGVRSFWKGNLAAEMMVAPYGAISFWSLQTFRKLLFKKDGHASPETQPYVSFLCGALSGACATIGTYPLDLFRTRLAVQKEKEVYQTLTHAARSVVQREGFRGLYRGVWPTLLGVVPYMAAQFTVYEAECAALYEYKRARHKLEGKDYSHSLASHEHLAVGFIAGVLSKLLTLPLDVIKKRTQVDGFDGQGQRGGGLMAPFRLAAHIFRTEGPGGLYRGLLPSLVKAGPNSATIFFTYNWCIRHCKEWEEAKHGDSRG